jgi:hypothetical protein
MIVRFLNKLSMCIKEVGTERVGLAIHPFRVV